MNFNTILQGNIFSLHSGAGLFAIKLEFRKEGDLNSSPDLLIFCTVKILPVITALFFFFSILTSGQTPNLCFKLLRANATFLRTGCALRPLLCYISCATSPVVSDLGPQCPAPATSSSVLQAGLELQHAVLVCRFRIRGVPLKLLSSQLMTDFLNFVISPQKSCFHSSPQALEKQKMSAQNCCNLGKMEEFPSR